MVGRDIRLDGMPFTVVGVVPRHFQLLADTSIWAVYPILGAPPAVRTIYQLRAIGRIKAGVSIEVEVDTLDQLRDALAGGPDIVLLDNMDPATLRQAVAIRDELAPPVRLEASGGVTLDTVGVIARTGVDRISVGALTHSAVALDLGFDWHRSE